MVAQKYSDTGVKISGMPPAGAPPLVTCEVASISEASDIDESGFAWSNSASVGALPSATKRLP